MSETQDIRVWAKQQGLDVAAKGKIPVAVMDRWQQRDVPEDEDAAVGSPEIEPTQAKPLGGKKRSWWQGAGKSEPQSAKPVKRRVSIESVVSSAWGVGAMLLASKPGALPVARVLDMQAPVAGYVVNDMARGTIVDKALQPFARAGQSGEKLMGLLGPPLIVGAITNRPELYPVLRPVLKMSIMSWMEISEPAMRKAEKRASDFAEKFGSVDVDGMIDALFAPPPGWQEQPSPEEEEAIRRAQGM